MKRRTSFPFIWIFAALLLVLSLPKPFADTIRSTAISLAAPLWGTFFPGQEAEETKAALLRLQLENNLLKTELVHTEELLKETVTWNRTFDVPASDMAAGKISTLPAKVIYRASSTWNSSLWIDVGEEQNSPQLAIVAKNSPVVVGNSLVGVIDYVGKRQSRVCLITDDSLVPSVRALRGQPVERHLAKSAAHLADRLADRPNIFASAAERTAFLEALAKLQQALQTTGPPANAATYLAKGELHGNSAPLWRSAGTLLKGIGFNYDYADDRGPARDLRRGTLHGSTQSEAATPLLQLQDLLVTTGLDGVFPPGLNVAEIVHIFPLKEGDYFYELLARPTAGNLDDLNLVFILPPLGYNAVERPATYEH